MKFTIITGSISHAAGGTFDAIRRPAQIFKKKHGVRVYILGLKDAYTEVDRNAWTPLKPEAFSVVGPVSFGYAPGMLGRLCLQSPDLIHVHGIWMYYSLVSLKYSKRYHAPCIISPHGMLDPWAIKNSGWKKKMVGVLYENKHLRGAACLHALCESEARAIREYGLCNPICLIPNGTDLADHNKQFPPPWKGAIENGKKVLLFLSRVHPKKGLINLLHAWSRLQKRSSASADGWALAIAGWDQLGHEAEVKALCEELGIANSIRFIGPQFGDQKLAAYQNAHAFILPSYSEGLPMTVLEAWANKLPVLITPECNLPEGFQTNAAIKILPNPESIFVGLLQLVDMAEDERRQIGEAGFTLVREKFSWEKITSDMYSVYEWLLGGGPPPSCIIMN